MSIDFVWKLRSMKSGLFYANRTGRRNDNITNMTKKGQSYMSEKVAKNMLKIINNRPGQVCVNRTQVEKYGYNLSDCSYSYGATDLDEFELVKFKLIEVCE